jgi:hypothetical protein
MTMHTLNLFAVIVLAIAISVVLVLVVLGSLPGKIARKRNRRHALTKAFFDERWKSAAVARVPMKNTGAKP